MFLTETKKASVELMDLINTLGNIIVNYSGELLALLSVVGTFIGAYFAFRQSSKKDIKLQIISKSSYLDFRGRRAKYAKVRFENGEVKNAVKTIIRITNSGNQPIEIKDFHRPISFKFEKEIEFFNASIVNSKPKNINATVSIKENILTLHKTLMNPKDTLDISFITPNKEEPIIDYRISGVSDEIKLLSMVTSGEYVHVPGMLR